MRASAATTTSSMPIIGRYKRRSATGSLIGTKEEVGAISST
jgi:hypothetical protein